MPELTNRLLAGALLDPYFKRGFLIDLARSPLLLHHLNGPLWVHWESPREAEP